MSIKIYSENLIDQSTITASDENALFPVSNLKDYRRSKVYRSLTNSASVVLDFNETSLVDTFIVVGDKRSGVGFSTIKLEFNGTNNWASPARTELIDFSTQLNVGIKTFASAEYRFCRVVLTSTLGYCELSKIFIGKALEIGRGINFGWSYKDEDLSQSKTNRYGQKFIDIIARQRIINAAMSLLDKNMLDKFFDVYDRCGESKPFWVAIGCDNMSVDNRRFCMPVFFGDIPTITNGSFGRYGLSMSLREAM